MNEDLLSTYIAQFNKLNQGTSRNLGKAPHKPLLLLSIIELIKKKEIISNRIFINSKLVVTFRDMWKKLVSTGHTENFALPFFHMRSEPFWYLIEKPAGEISLTRSRSIKSFKNLKENIAFAEIDKNLFSLLNDSMKNSLKKKYL